MLGDVIHHVKCQSCLGGKNLSDLEISMCIALLESSLHFYVPP